MKKFCSTKYSLRNLDMRYSVLRYEVQHTEIHQTNSLCSVEESDIGMPPSARKMLFFDITFQNVGT